MRKYQPQQETESDVCAGQEVMGASEAGGMEHEQLYGNQAAQERLCGEPIDIDVIDRDGSIATAFAAGLVGEDTQVDVEGGVKGMVAEVIAKAEGRPIRRLSIFSHARAGTFYMGGELVSSGSPEYRFFDLSKLAPMFSDLGFVELHGCNVGEGVKGEMLLERMTRALGVPVTAGERVQLAATPGLDGSTVTGDIDEEGEFTLSRDEHPDADVVLRGREALGELYSSGMDLGEETLRELADAGSELIESLHLPEVGDLEQWLFGA